MEAPLTSHHLALDLGAESGRLIAATLEGDRLSLEEIHRFSTGATREGHSLTWDIPRIWQDVQTALTRAATLDRPWSSLGTDSWGVDYLLFRADGSIVHPTFHYRDARTARGVAAAHARIPWTGIFAETGIQFMPLNTLYQLAAEAPDRLAQTDRLLLIGDGFNRLLSGVAVAEASLASTSMLYRPADGTWSSHLCCTLHLPQSILPPIVPSGTRLGPLLPDLASRVGLAASPPEVIASCSHDTAAAVVGVPSEGDDWAYLSSGTWSLMGVECPTPVLTAAARERNFTNEIGFGNTVRLLKNISGLWLLQECRRAWTEAGHPHDYTQLVALAEAAPPFRSLIRPDHPCFLAPDGMPDRIAAFCRDRGEPVPESPGAMVRCILESLALLYRQTRDQIQEVTGRSLQRLHIVGGGSQNALLNQFTASALGIPVHAGPVEATAAGNVLVQAFALGRLPSLASMRAVVRRSFPVQVFHPEPAHPWNAAYHRFQTLGAN
ncbi:MAG: rhamnulokinase [Verrucomicrobiae bacterium]|nr:rhamnulokinase [Verrucomicrobiae bacterium]